MLLGTPETVPGWQAEDSHGGVGSYFVRTLLDAPAGSCFLYVRYLVLDPGSTIGKHAHEGDDEVYIITAGRGMMEVDGETLPVGPGAAVLTVSGSRHALRNTGSEEMTLYVACADHPGLR